jgi:hypothetical protein
MRPSYRRAAVVMVPVVLIVAAIAAFAAFAGSARAGTSTVAAQPAATCQGSSSCSLNQEVLMPLKINIWTDASPEQGQHGTVSWTLSCGGNGGTTNTSGSTSGTVPFRTKLKVPQSGGADCQLSATISISGGGAVTAGLYPTSGSQVMISLPTGDTRPGAPLAYYKCLTAKYNSNRAGTPVVIGGCGSIYANTWYYDGTHFTHGSMCLTDPRNGGNRTRLVIDPCTGSADQAWSYRPQHRTVYDEIVLHAHGGTMCVDDKKNAAGNGSPLDLYTCNGGATQNWTLSGH